MAPVAKFQREEKVILFTNIKLTHPKEIKKCLDENKMLCGKDLFIHLLHFLKYLKVILKYDVLC